MRGGWLAWRGRDPRGLRLRELRRVADDGDIGDDDPPSLACCVGGSDGDSEEYADDAAEDESDQAKPEKGTV